MPMRKRSGALCIFGRRGRCPFCDDSLKRPSTTPPPFLLAAPTFFNYEVLRLAPRRCGEWRAADIANRDLMPCGRSHHV
jgi:hypothetical protein